jgi:hypothetical protein
MACAVPKFGFDFWGGSTVYAAMKVGMEIASFIAQAMAILFSVGFMALMAWIFT